MNRKEVTQEGKKEDKTFHVHVYVVIGMLEVAVHADDKEGARRKALELVGEKSFFEYDTPDCRRIAIAFEEDGMVEEIIEELKEIQACLSKIPTSIK